MRRTRGQGARRELSLVGRHGNAAQGGTPRAAATETRLLSFLFRKRWCRSGGGRDPQPPGHCWWGCGRAGRTRAVLGNVNMERTPRSSNHVWAGPQNKAGPPDRAAPAFRAASRQPEAETSRASVGGGQGRRGRRAGVGTPSGLGTGGSSDTGSPAGRPGPRAERQGRPDTAGRVLWTLSGGAGGGGGGRTRGSRKQTVEPGPVGWGCECFVVTEFPFGTMESSGHRTEGPLGQQASLW